MNFKTENIEFKSGFTEEIYKEVIAFANADGGIVYAGIDNDGNAVGLTDIDNEYANTQTVQRGLKCFIPSKKKPTN